MLPFSKLMEEAELEALLGNDYADEKAQTRRLHAVMGFRHFQRSLGRGHFDELQVTAAWVQQESSASALAYSDYFDGLTAKDREHEMARRFHFRTRSSTPCGSCYQRTG